MIPELLNPSFGRTRVMGIVNVTPDSFSDGGKWASADAAIARGHELIGQGADILDIGGESTRPGARILTPEEEWVRIEPVVRELSNQYPVSVDTYHAQTARLAAEAGAHIINDVTGGQGDPEMFAAVARTDALYILQHGRGNAQEMNELAKYTDIGAEVAAELTVQLGKANAAGIDSSRIIVDPGFGFAKMGEDDWNLAVALHEVYSLGHPVLVGVSRKRFLERVGTMENGEILRDASARDDATAALSMYFAMMGTWAVRVHEVAASRVATEVEQQLRFHQGRVPENTGGCGGGGCGSGKEGGCCGGGNCGGGGGCGSC